MTMGAINIQFVIFSTPPWSSITTILSLLLFFSMISTSVNNEQLKLTTTAKHNQPQLLNSEHHVQQSIDNDFFMPKSIYQLYQQLNRNQDYSEMESTNNINNNNGQSLHTIHLSKANTIRSYKHFENNMYHNIVTKNKNIFHLYFNIKQKINETLKAAELIVHREPLPLNSDISYQSIFVYDIIKLFNNKKSEPILRLIDTKTVNVQNEDPINLDVLPAVERWYQNISYNFGLLIKITKNYTNTQLAHIRLQKYDNESMTHWSQLQPYLTTYTDDSSSKDFLKTATYHHRIKRSPTNDNQIGNSRRHSSICRRYPLYVDFEAVGWQEWIIAPRGYDAFYCHGECPFPLDDHLNSTNHAIVQTLIRNVNHNAVPEVCCVPTKFSQLYMLYKDNDNSVILKKYRNMVVEGCGCR